LHYRDFSRIFFEIHFSKRKGIPSFPFFSISLQRTNFFNHHQKVFPLASGENPKALSTPPEEEADANFSPLEDRGEACASPAQPNGEDEDETGLLSFF
jgi:hypothetical protein